MKDNIIKSVDLYAAAEKRYIDYSTEANEDRAIQCVSDGLKPVQRRALWAMFKLGLNHTAKYAKAGKVVGTVLGDYHPHGDSSIYEAMITIARKVPIAMIYGSGNWGTFTGDKAAAYRYTECRLSLYSDTVFFDPFYNPVIQTVLNYNDDENYREPVVLNALLPNALINPVGGIGVGVAVDMPMFTVPSIIQTLKSALKQGTCTQKHCTSLLEFTNPLKGIPTISTEERIEFFKSGKGRVQFDTKYDVDEKKRTITLHSRFANVNFLNAMEKTLADPKVKSCNEVPNKKEKTFDIFIELRSNVPHEDVKSTAKAIVQKYFRNNESYEVTTTHRHTEDNETTKKRLEATNTPNMINDWIKARLELEIKACQYWIDKVQKEIDYRKLLIRAVDKLEVVIAALRGAVKNRWSKDQLRDYIAKHMKMTDDEAEIIIGLRLHQLRKLEKELLITEIRDRENSIAGWKKRIKNPAEYVITDLDRIQKKLAAFI